ncbi:hypothetical protein [Polaribacter sp.]|uniref:hypothetical protein n=1 Tax=Polaribacter sp. TaxID=1920175 RepID=UPI003F69BC0F
MSKKYKKLVLSIVLDLIGLIPLIDIIWAPLSGYIMTKLYKGTKGKVAGIIGYIAMYLRKVKQKMMVKLL